MEGEADPILRLLSQESSRKQTPRPVGVEPGVTCSRRAKNRAAMKIRVGRVRSIDQVLKDS